MVAAAVMVDGEADQEQESVADRLATGLFGSDQPWQDIEALRAVYDGISDGVRDVCEKARRGMREDFVKHLQTVNKALAPTLRFREWCEAVGLNYNTAKSILRRADASKLAKDKDKGANAPRPVGGGGGSADHGPGAMTREEKEWRKKERTAKRVDRVLRTIAEAVPETINSDLDDWLAVYSAERWDGEGEYPHGDLMLMNASAGVAKADELVRYLQGQFEGGAGVADDGEEGTVKPVEVKPVRRERGLYDPFDPHEMAIDREIAEKVDRANT